jgi:hypothetical protein
MLGFMIVKINCQEGYEMGCIFYFIFCVFHKLRLVYIQITNVQIEIVLVRV